MTFKITTVYPDGREEVRDATAQEVATWEQIRADGEAAEAERKAAEAAAQAARESALAKLAALGLTEAEAAAIIK